MNVIECVCGDSIDLSAWNEPENPSLVIQTHGRRQLQGQTVDYGEQVFITDFQMTSAPRAFREHIEAQRQAFMNAWWAMHASCREGREDEFELEITDRPRDPMALRDQLHGLILPEGRDPWS